MVPEHPEARARRQIDAMLANAGWAVQASPDAIAAEIADDLRSALEQIEGILVDLSRAPQ